MNQNLQATFHIIIISYKSLSLNFFTCIIEEDLGEAHGLTIQLIRADQNEVKVDEVGEIFPDESTKEGDDNKDA